MKLYEIDKFVFDICNQKSKIAGHYIEIISLFSRSWNYSQRFNV